MKNTTLIPILCLVLASLAAAIPKRYLFSTTSIDSVALTTLGTNLLAQSTPTTARTVLLITNATGLEATAANLTTVSNAQATTSANLATVSNTVTNHSNTLATNTALLNGTNTFAGTNMFPAASFFKANSITIRTLLSTNVAWSGNVNPLTNTPPTFTDTTNVAYFTVPALLGSNSIVRISLLRWQPNSEPASTYWILHGGNGTNFLSAGGGIGTTAVTNWVSSAVAFKNNGAFTQQIVNLGQAQSSGWLGVTSIDTSTPWKAWLGFTHSTGAAVATNLNVTTVVFEEIVIP